MTSALMLESFEVAIAEKGTVSPEYSQGYQDGMEAGTAAAQVEIGMLDDALLQAISDIEFTYAEARGQLLQSLEPLFKTLVQKLLPQCVESGFAAQVIDTLRDAVEQDSQAAITLHLHPQNVAQISDRLAGLAKQVDVKPDPTLTSHAAWLLQGRTETYLDIDSLLEDITAALGSLFLEQNGTNTHG